MAKFHFCVLFSACGLTVFGQTTPAAAAPKPAAAKPSVAAPAGPKPIKWGKITVSGSLRTRFEGWDSFQADTGDGSYGFSGSIARLSLSQSLENWDWQIEMAAPILLGLPSNAVAAGTQGALGLGANYFTANDRNRNSVGLFAKQAFVRYKQGPHSLRVGRFEYMDGSEMTPKNGTLAAIKNTRINQRLLGHFGFTHVGRSFDGVHYQFNKPTGNFTLMTAVPTRGVFQTDGWGWNKTAFGYAAYTKPWGKGAHAGETRVLALYYEDWRNGVVKTDNRSLVARRADQTADIRIGTFGGHSIHAFDTKKVTYDLMIWGVGQTGKWGVLSHRAHAISLEGGFQPKAFKKLKPWFRGGFYDGSGDGNPNDSTHGTFFQVLPTPRPFARFPFFNMMNNRDWLGSMVLRPHAKVTISTEFHALALSNRNDLWLQGGGVFQPWTFGYAGRSTSGAKSLANLYDFNIDYRVRPNITVTGYVGHAQGLAAIRTIYPKGTGSNFGYLELLYRF